MCAPGNAGISAEGVETPRLDASDPTAVANFVVDRAFDLVVIGPEAPLVAGVADPLRERGILKRLRGTPLPTSAYLAGLAANAIANAVLQLAIVIVVALVTV